METEFETRKQELLNECTVAAQVFDRVVPRLERFMEPFVESLVRQSRAAAQSLKTAMIGRRRNKRPLAAG